MSRVLKNPVFIALASVGTAFSVKSALDDPFSSSKFLSATALTIITGALLVNAGVGSTSSSGVYIEPKKPDRISRGEAYLKGA